MKKNIGKSDKSVRIAIALVIGVLILLDVISGTLATVLLVVSLVLLVTSFINFCPIWAALGINTIKEKQEKE